MTPARSNIDPRRYAVALLSEAVLCRVRDLLANPDRPREKDQFLSGLLDAVHNIALWLEKSRDPYQEVLDYVRPARPEVRSWIEARLAYELERASGYVSPHDT